MLNRLLSINNYHYRRAGAEVVYFTQNELFEGCGWHVAHFAMQHPKNEASEWADFFPRMIEFSEMNSIVERLAAAPKIIYNLEAKRNMSRLLDVAKPSVAHAHNVYHHLSPSIFSEIKERSIPLVVTLHDLKLACPAYKMLNSKGICEECKSGSFLPIVRNRCMKESLLLSTLIGLESSIHRYFSLYGAVDAFVVPSQFYKNKLVEWGYEHDRFHVIPNSVSVSSFTPEFEPGSYYLYFGRLAPEKGVETLLKAAALAKVSLRIVGSGEIEKEIHLLAETLDVDVQFDGFLRGDSLHEAVRLSRAVVLPSEWYENAPMSLLESNALGKPVIGADTGGIPEFIKDGETGFIYSGEVEELAAILTRVDVLENKAIRDMGVRARAYVQEHYSHELYIERLLSLYRRLGVTV